MQPEHSIVTRIGGLKVLVIVALAITSLALAGCSPSPEAKEQRLLKDLKEIFNERVNYNRQAMFNRIHPTGQANRAEVNDVAISRWRSGERTGTLNDVAAVDCVFTIHWDSPLVPNGYTRIFIRHDRSVGRIVETRVLDTNGLTNQNASNMVELLDGLLLLSQ